MKKIKLLLCALVFASGVHAQSGFDNPINWSIANGVLCRNLSSMPHCYKSSMPPALSSTPKKLPAWSKPQLFSYSIIKFFIL
jgi:hypothetical protein